MYETLFLYMHFIILRQKTWFTLSQDLRFQDVKREMVTCHTFNYHWAEEYRPIFDTWRHSMSEA